MSSAQHHAIERGIVQFEQMKIMSSQTLILSGTVEDHGKRINIQLDFCPQASKQLTTPEQSGSGKKEKSYEPGQ